MNAPSAQLSPAIRRARLALDEGAVATPWACTGWTAPEPGFVDLWLLDLPALAAVGPSAPADWSALARFQLRRLIGTALDQSPETVEIVAGARGKPELRARGTPPLFFNTSRSGSTALFALSRDTDIGVDIERHRFGHAAYLCSTHDLGDTEFGRRWTRHEAVVKGAGFGLSVRTQPPLGFVGDAGTVQFGAALWAWRDLALPADVAADAALAFRPVQGNDRCG